MSALKAKFLLIQIHVLVRVHLSVYSRLKGLMVKILNKCILSMLVYNLFYKTDSAICPYTAIYPYTGILAVCLK